MKVYFHVVTSVKGGSGKSTVALLLADYLLSKGKEAYVIDLDVCGTSWYVDYKFAYKDEPTKFINRMMYQHCTKGYGDNVWSKLKVTGAEDGNKNRSREINVCLAANEQLSHSINKSEAELVEHTTYHLIKDAMYGSSRVGEKEEVHIIFDLPPSHETTVEQICHHLLFDQRSVLKRDLVKGDVDYQVYFYLVSPADQGSAFLKNVEYIKNFGTNPTYSESLTKWFAWQIINDNHNWVGAFSVNKKDLIARKAKNHLGIEESKDTDNNIGFAFVEYTSFDYKENYVMGDYVSGTKDSLEINKYIPDPFEIIYSEIEKKS